MVVKTQSGNFHMLTTKSGKVYMLYRGHDYLVDKFEVGIGFPLKVWCHSINPLTDAIENNPILITATPVVEVVL